VWPAWALCDYAWITVYSEVKRFENHVYRSNLAISFWILGTFPCCNLILRSGDPAEIKTKRVKKQKTDRNDARLLRRLMLENNFPQIWIPNPENRDLRQLPFTRRSHQIARWKAIEEGGIERTEHCSALSLAGAVARA
jgi:hypothetical protein